MELVQVIFIYYNVFKFHIPRLISFGVIAQKHRWKNTDTHLDAHKDPDEYSIVVTIIVTSLQVTKGNLPYSSIAKYEFISSLNHIESY